MKSIYINELEKAIEHWNKDPIEDEWFFEKFRQSQINSMDSLEAFNAINATVNYLFIEKDEYTACEILQTILNLADKSQTTEIPSELIEFKDEIQNKFYNWGEYARSKWNELIKFYRF